MARLLGFNPSNASRWVNCAGAVLLSQPFLSRPSEESEAALEGQAAHWVAEQLFAGRQVKVGDVTPSKILVDQEMLEGAQEYVDVLPASAWLEHKVSLEDIAPGMYGYIDAVNDDVISKTLDVYDFKYGHTHVEEFENWQLLVECYPYVKEGYTIHLHIVQPRCYQAQTHRTWTLSAEDYLTTYLPTIKEAAKQVQAGEPNTCTGKQCHHCPAASACDALARAAYKAIDVIKEATSHELTNVELARELEHLEDAQALVKSRLIGLEEAATSKITSGERVPGYTLSSKQGKLKWTAPEETVIGVAKLSGVDVSKPPAALTPLQAIKAGMTEATVNSLSARAASSNKLTRVNHNQAKKVFN